MEGRGAAMVGGRGEVRAGGWEAETAGGPEEVKGEDLAEERGGD